MKEMGSSTLGNQMTECEPHSYGPDPATLLPPELSSWLQRRRGKGRWASLPPAPSYTRQRGTEGASHPLLLLKSPVRSRRRCGRMPSGPTADPLGKEQMVCATSSTVTVQLVMDPSEGGGIQELGCGDGCFTFRAIMVSSFNCRTELLEQMSCTAPCNLPPQVWLKLGGPRISEGPALTEEAGGWLGWGLVHPSRL